VAFAAAAAIGFGRDRGIGNATAGQIGTDVVGATLRQADVIFVGTRTVGVTGENHRSRSDLLIASSRIVEDRGRCRRDLILVPIEEHDERTRIDDLLTRALLGDRDGRAIGAVLHRRRLDRRGLANAIGVAGPARRAWRDGLGLGRRAEVEGDATEQAVRTEPRFRLEAAEIHGPEIVGIEEAVAHGDVDIVADRLTDAGDDLPREAGVGIIDDRRLVRIGADIVIVDAGDTDAGTNEAADAVIVAEVQHAVDHEAERARAPAAGREDVWGDDAAEPAGGAVSRRPQNGPDIVDVGALVGNLRLDAERAEIVADEKSSVEAVIVVEHDLGRRAARDGRSETEIEVDVLDDHPAEIAADIPGVVARQSRSCEHGGRQRHNNGELPHNLPLSSASRSGTT